jgi:hypothetical protein
MMRLGVVVACLGVIACVDALGPAARRPATVYLDIQGPRFVRTVSVEVSGPGIDSLLVFNIGVDSTGAGSGVARIPAGAGRLVVARAFDAQGINTHRGDTTVTLLEGTNNQLALVLRPLTGNLPVTITFGGSGITLTPGDTTITVGDTVRYSAGGVDSLGNAIPPAAVVWSSTERSIASVSSGGLVTARAAGVAYALATYQGASRGRKVTVQ